MRKTNNSKGVTVIALVVTVVILFIIAGIGISAGGNSLKKVQMEELKTNMLLIEAKAREYVEEANFKIGKETDATKIAQIKNEIYGDTENGAKLQLASEAGLTNIPEEIPISECYVVTQATFEKWGLNKIKLKDNEYYLIKFDETNIDAEIYNTKGYYGKYSLTAIEEL